MAVGMAMGSNHGNSGNHGNSADHSNKGRGMGSLVRIMATARTTENQTTLTPISASRGRALWQSIMVWWVIRRSPGIAKNLVRGKPLPPGIAKKTLPASMINDLPYYPGYEWRAVGDDLVLVALSTAIVTSIINGVLTNANLFTLRPRKCGAFIGESCTGQTGQSVLRAAEFVFIRLMETSR